MENKIRYNTLGYQSAQADGRLLFDNTQLMKQADAGGLFEVFTKEGNNILDKIIRFV